MVPPESAPPVEEIEEKVLAAFAAQTPESAGETAPETAEESAPAEEAPADDYPERDPFAREDLDATRRINLDELKFGRNYSGEE